MILTFLKRWWLVNRLYHYQKINSQLWVLEDRFLQQAFDSWNDGTLEGRAKEKKQKQELQKRQIIEWCTRPEINWIEKRNDNGVSRITLSATGQDAYSFSFVIGKKILGNHYIKTILTAIFILLITNFIVNNVIQDVSQALQ